MNQGCQIAGNADLWYTNILEEQESFGTSGLNFIPGGYRSRWGLVDYGAITYYSFFWTSTPSDYLTTSGDETAWQRFIVHSSTGVSRDSYRERAAGYSIRCIED